MPKETTEKGFQYNTPRDFSSPIISTGLASLGGACGAKFGLIDPESQGTTLFAKINGYFFGFFQAGVEWGNSLGIKNIDRKTDADSVHAEEYFIAALTDSWELLTKDGIIKEEDAPSITVKITKTPCPGCAPQLVDFVKKQKCYLRIKAAQLWGHKSHKYPTNITAVDELGSAGITVIPWNLFAKIGKERRKNFCDHELRFLSNENFSSDDVKRLQDDYNVLRKELGLKENDKFEQRLKAYKNKSLSKEAFLAYSKEISSQLLTDISGKMSKMETKLTTLQEELDKASKAPVRRSPRDAVKVKTETQTLKKKEATVAKQQKLLKEQELLGKRKEFYESMKTS